MNKTKELIETWKEIDKYFNDAENSMRFMADEYCCSQAEIARALKKLNEFEALRKKLDEIIKSLEAENERSND